MGSHVTGHVGSHVVEGGEGWDSKNVPYNKCRVAHFRGTQILLGVGVFCVRFVSRVSSRSPPCGAVSLREVRQPSRVAAQATNEGHVDE